MPGLNNPYVLVSGELIEMGIRVEGKCQAGGQGQAAVEKEAPLTGLLPGVLCMSTENVSVERRLTPQVMLGKDS